MPVPPFVEEFPADDGLGIPTHTGGPAPEIFDDPMITEVPEAVGPSVVFSEVEESIVGEARNILDAPEMDRLREAFETQQPATVQIGGRTIQFEPGLPASGMTMFGESGFLLGNEAFETSEELTMNSP